MSLNFSLRTVILNMWAVVPQWTMKLLQFSNEVFRGEKKRKTKFLIFMYIIFNFKKKKTAGNNKKKKQQLSESKSINVEPTSTSKILQLEMPKMA